MPQNMRRSACYLWWPVATAATSAGYPPRWGLNSMTCQAYSCTTAIRAELVSPNRASARPLSGWVPPWPRSRRVNAPQDARRVCNHQSAVTATIRWIRRGRYGCCAWYSPRWLDRPRHTDDDRPLERSTSNWLRLTAAAAKALSSLLKLHAHAGNTNAKNGWTTQAVRNQQWAQQQNTCRRVTRASRRRACQRTLRLITVKTTRIRQGGNGLSAPSSR